MTRVEEDLISNGVTGSEDGRNQDEKTGATSWRRLRLLKNTGVGRRRYYRRGGRGGATRGGVNLKVSDGARRQFILKRERHTHVAEEHAGERKPSIIHGHQGKKMKSSIIDQHSSKNQRNQHIKSLQ